MTNMKNGMGIGDERDDVVDMANRIYGVSLWHLTIIISLKSSLLAAELL